MAWGPGYRFEAVLHYEGRPDPTVSYREGFEVITNRRLARVDVWTRTATPTLLRSYELTYDETRSLSRLASVRMTGLEGAGAMPELTLSYWPTRATQVHAPSGLDGWQLETRGVAFFDIDGDGMDDLYRLEMGNHEYRKNLGASFGPRTPIGGATALELEQVRFVDLDGDARPELVRIVDDTWRYSRLVDGRWETVGAWPGTRNLPLSGAGTEVVDVNGDGRMDVVQAVTGGLHVSFGGKGGMGSRQTRPPIDPSNPFIEPGGSNVKFVEVNGDGLVDVVWLNDAWMRMFLGRGDGTFHAWRRTFYPWPDQAIDIRDLRLADLNRDGLLDLVRFTASHVLLFQGQADGSFSWYSRHVARPEADGTDVTVAVTDANGNGSLDIVWSSPRGMWIADLAGATSAGMLTDIDNGLGKVMHIDYDSSAQLAVEAEQAGEPWQRKLPVSVPVPVRVTINPGSGPTRVVHHGVRDGFWDPVERRFGGFLEGRRSISGLAGADVLYEVTRLHPGEGDERVLRGKPTYVRVANGLGQTRSTAYTEWAAHPIEDLPDHPLLRVAVTRETRTSHEEGVPEPIDTLVWFVHDGQARVVEEHDLGRLDRQGDEATRVVRYAANNEAKWIRDRVCEEKLYSRAGSLVSWTQTLFGGTGPLDVEALCELGDVALERRTQGWLDEESRWVTLSEVEEYSPHHNPLVVYAEGVTRNLGYDLDDFHLTSESVSPQTGTTLTWTLGWDLARDLPVSVTDPAGATTEITYDELGRLATVAQANAPPHTRYEYDWTAPRPTTTTYVFDGPEANLGQWSGGYAEGAGWRQTTAVANGAGEVLFTATRLGASRWLVSEWTERDERGRTRRVFDSFEWTAPDVRGAAPPVDWPADQLTYDAFDRLRQHERPTGTLRRIEYAAFRRTVTDDDLAPVTSFFDGQDRVIRTERTIGSTVETGEASYDAAGRLLALRLQPTSINNAQHTFEYDSLGRLTFATDPDIGDRHLLHDDRGFLIEKTNAAGQTVEYTYDGAGRLTSVLADDGSSFTYHYDVPQDPSYQYTAGRLAWVEELTGSVQVGYDSRGRQVRFQRTIVDAAASVTLSAEDELTFAPSGLLRSVDFKDGLVVDLTYDDAGRPIQIGNLWTVQQYDAAGRILDEQYGNGVTQAYRYDDNGDLEDVKVRRPAAAGGGLLYDVAVTRNGFGAIATVADSDGVGLDHNASFTYDLAGRLTDAAIGATGPTQYQFSYAYDGLQNMIQRTASGPAGLGVLAGEYRYGGPRSTANGGGTHGPRQLTGIAPLGSAPTDPPTNTFEYDLAGRLVQQDGLTLTYNGLDQLTRVEGIGGSGTVEHAYGYDGFRVLTRNTAGATQYWFTPSITERNGLREHYIRLGDRLIARVDQRELPPGGTGGFVIVADGRRAAQAFTLALVALFIFLVLRTTIEKPPRPRRRRRWAHAAATAAVALAALAQSACSLFGSGQSPLWENAGTVYFHHGISPGPTLLTREDGSVREERRYEPFGEELDAFREQPGGTGGTTGAIDYTVDSHNILNKQTDRDTGWSYHGARWMAPETARWLTPDPPVKVPDPQYVAEPWRAHPYQYVTQNPIAFWDPDGYKRRPVRRRPVIRGSGSRHRPSRAERAQDRGRLKQQQKRDQEHYRRNLDSIIRPEARVLPPRERSRLQSLRSAEFRRQNPALAGWLSNLTVHGNSLKSTRPQHIYVIIRTDALGRSEVFKYGISGGRIRRDGRSYRAEHQVRNLNRWRTGGFNRQWTYQSFVIEHIPRGPGARARAVQRERELVYTHQEHFGHKPEGNIYP